MTTEEKIETPEGTMTAVPGSWIVRGIEGEEYPVQDSIFRATYEPADLKARELWEK